MSENNILKILQSKSEIEMAGRILEFYPNGFKVEDLDDRIQKRLWYLKEQFAKCNNTIEDIRRKI